MPFTPGNTSDLQTQMALQSLLRGLNTMQMQSGLTPGGVPIPQAPMMQPHQMFQPMHPAQFSSQLRMDFMQHQQMAQMISPMPMGSMTPVGRTSMFMPNMPSQQWGDPAMAAHSRAVLGMNNQMGMAQAGMGLGFRAAGMLGSMATAGPLGMYQYENSGMGQSFQAAGMNLFNPLIAQRAQALQLQRQSMSFVHGGSDLGAMGMGLSMTASQRLNTGLMGMADSRGFQHATGGMFNRQDVMRITQLSGQFGMLDQSQTADQIKQQVGRISRSLSNFMRIAEQPDLQEAMRMMGQMRSLGMNITETTTAARNARMFARMAGTDTGTIMQQGMQGAGVFQQAGLSGASGMMAGMAAGGMSASLASLMDPRRLSMAGGAGGIAQTLMGGAAQAGISDPILASMLTRRGGHLAIDREALMSMARGDSSIQQLMQSGAGRVRALGGREVLMEMATRRRELQDQAQGMMGGTLSTLMPLIQASAIMRGTPGMTMGGALRTLGMGEQQARTYEQMSQDPRFWENMRRQQRQEMAEQRREVQEQRDEAAQAAGTGGFARSARRHLDSLNDRFTNATGAAERYLFGAGQDVEEAAGGDGVIRADTGVSYGSETGRRALRSRLRTRGGVSSYYQQLRGLRPDTDATIAAEDAEARGQSGLRRGRAMALLSGNIGTALADTAYTNLMGPSGFSGTGPRGEFLRETVEAQGSLTSRALATMGLGPDLTRAQVEARARDIQQVGRIFEHGQAASARERTQTARSTITAIQRSSIGGDADRAADIVGRASAALGTMMASRTTGYISGSTTSAPTSTEIIATVRQSFIDQGMSADEASRMASDPAILRQVAAHSDISPEAHTAIAAAISGGGRVGASQTAESAAALRARSRDESRAVLETLGVSTGPMSHTGLAGQRQLLGVLSGSGETASAQRDLLAARALRAAGGAENAAQAAALETSVENRYGREIYNQATAELAEATSDVSDSSLADVGRRLQGRSTSQIRATLDQLSNKAGHAGLGDAAAAQVTNMGAEAYNASLEGVDALVAFARGGGHLGDASAEEAAAIAGGDRTAAERYMQRQATQAAQSAGGDINVTTAAGRSQLGEALASGDINTVMDSISRLSMGSAGEEGTPAEPEIHSMEEAVPIFAEASRALLEAAHLFNGDRAMDAMGNAVNAAAGTVPAFVTALPGMGAVGIGATLLNSMFRGR